MTTATMTDLIRAMTAGQIQGMTMAPTLGMRTARTPDTTTGTTTTLTEVKSILFFRIYAFLLEMQTYATLQCYYFLFRISDSRYDDYDGNRRLRYDDAPLDDYSDEYEDYSEDDSEDDGVKFDTHQRNKLIG